MTTEKSARAWFEMLKEPYRSQAIEASENAVQISRIEKLYPSLSEALINDFIWDDTPQEWLCWHKIHKSIARGETTYLADDNDTTDGWVKCSDRLPSEIGEYLLYCAAVDMNEQKFHEVGCWDGEKFIVLSEDSYPTQITHWRELPEPPNHNPCTP